MLSSNRPSSNSRAEEGFTLIELVLTLALLGVVLAIVGNFLVNSDRTVAASTASMDANAAAQDAFDRLDADIRFACEVSIPSQGASTVYLLNSPDSNCSTSEPGASCAEWTLSGQQLTRQVSGEASAGEVATGVSSLSFATNTAYPNLVGVSLQIQPQSSIGSPSPVSLDETVSATNIPSGSSVEVSSTPVCTP
jgi:prepilin-type N-terminal cleavage/methylation domain-containing protein